MNFAHIMEWVVRAFELAGVAVLAVGSLLVFGLTALRRIRGPRIDEYASLREGLGRVILLGLEILIVADIVKTVTVETTIQTAASLAIIVAVRTFLSFSLEIELYGEPPWKRAALKRSRDRSPKEEPKG